MNRRLWSIVLVLTILFGIYTTTISYAEPSDNIEPTVEDEEDREDEENKEEIDLDLELEAFKFNEDDYRKMINIFLSSAKDISLAFFMADSILSHTNTPSCVKLLDITILTLFGRGLTFKDSKVFLPIITMLSLVTSLKCFMSSGIFAKSSLFLPIPFCSSTATIIFSIMTSPFIIFFTIMICD